MLTDSVTQPAVYINVFGETLLLGSFNDLTLFLTKHMS